MTKPNFHVTALFNASASFKECLLFCVHGLRRLGYEVTLQENQLRPDAINIVLGSYTDLARNANWTAMSAQARDIIIYNWEQVGHDVPWFHPRYMRQMVHTHVWDYNQNNVAALKKAGVQDIHYVPMSYVPEMSVVPQVDNQDIDVLFYGVINPRRAAVLDALREKGLVVASTQELPWLQNEERDGYIARAKVVLNMHFFDVAKVFEIARVSYLLANHKAVVSEIAHGTDIDDDIRDAVVSGTVDELPQLCWDLVQDANRRGRVAEKGFQIFSQRNAEHVLKQAVDRFLAQRDAGLIGNQSNVNTDLPSVLKIGAGAQWHYECCNISARDDFAADIVLDIGQALPLHQTIDSWRFGTHTLRPESFDKIIAHHVFQRVDDLKMALTNCLNLLKDGGTLELTVPHDLSYDAWMHVDDKRTFNNQSWRSIIDDWWRHGWDTYRFEIINEGFGLHTDYGRAFLSEHNDDWGLALRTMRVIDSQTFTLFKRNINEAERDQLPHARFLD